MIFAGTPSFMLLFPIKARTMAWTFRHRVRVEPHPQGDRVRTSPSRRLVVGWLYLKRAWRSGSVARHRLAVKRRRIKLMPPNVPIVGCTETRQRPIFQERFRGGPVSVPAKSEYAEKPQPL
jgi:hypothetical protein